jgi:hypothetical protein
MDQPRQHVSSDSCHDQRKQRVLCHPLGHGALAVTKVPLCLWVLFSCLAGVVLASLVHVTCRTRCLIGNVVQGFLHLIQNVLSGVLLRWAFLITR